MGASSPPEARAESDASRLQTCFHLLARIEEQLLFADSNSFRLPIATDRDGTARIIDGESNP
jgi:hypothetical protein